MADAGYVPPPSVGHEIGVMFGFMGAMLLAMLLYLMLWKAGQKRSQKKEDQRRAVLEQKGIPGMGEKDGVPPGEVRHQKA
ncbi:hypothetical protein MMC09_004998 [Bachmanniomyces sp. S44760]|nr:hypothetical protein [Bachmanniomyces sp. S44760]